MGSNFGDFLTNVFMPKGASKRIRNSASSGLSHVVDLGCGLQKAGTGGLCQQYTHACTIICYTFSVQ